MGRITLFALIFFALIFLNPLQASKKDEYLSEYMKNVQKKIKRKWHPPKYTKSYLITAEFDLDLNGQILGEIKFNKTIDDAELKQAAREAILSAAPFKKFDKKLVTENIIIEFSFEYNVHNLKDIDNDGDLPIEIIRKKK